MASTPLLGLTLPADGTTNWGTLVNTSLSALIDSAIAGTTTITADSDVTLTSTAEAPNEARQMVILCSGVRTGLRTIVAPSSSKMYVVINNTTGGFGVTIAGSGPTTGVTIQSGSAGVVAWNGTDFVRAGGESIATATISGLIKLGSNTVQSTAANAVTSTASRTYALQLNGSGQGVINVPWTDTAPPTATASVSGVIKLGSDTVQATAANAVTATASRSYALQLDASGQALVNIPWTDTTYSAATSSVNGLVKLGSDTVQATAANAVTATASRSYAIQLNASGQTVVNVPWTDTVYTLPAATTTVLGGIKLGSDTAQTTAANAVTSDASRTYALQVNASGQAVVNVPWTSGSPGGSNTQIQFNNSGSFGGSTNLTFDGSSITVNGIVFGRGASSIASNVAIGSATLTTNTTGTNNIAIGTNAGLNNNTGERNIFVGTNAGRLNQSSNDTVAIGVQALDGQTNGGQNVAIGTGALGVCQTGGSNTAVGHNSLYQVISSGFNTAIGRNALFSSVGAGNTALGYNAGSDLVSGSNNVLIGGYSGFNGILNIQGTSNNVVLSDGQGTVRAWWDSGGRATFYEGLTASYLRYETFSTATSSSFTPNNNDYQQFSFLALTTAITVQNPSGSGAEGQRLIFRFNDNGTARAINWGTQYRAIGVTLPTTTVANKVTYVECTYNSYSATWDVLQVNQQA